MGTERRERVGKGLFPPLKKREDVLLPRPRSGECHGERRKKRGFHTPKKKVGTMLLLPPPPLLPPSRVSPLLSLLRSLRLCGSRKEGRATRTGRKEGRGYDCYREERRRRRPLPAGLPANDCAGADATESKSRTLLWRPLAARPPLQLLFKSAMARGGGGGGGGGEEDVGGSSSRDHGTLRPPPLPALLGPLHRRGLPRRRRTMMKSDARRTRRPLERRRAARAETSVASRGVNGADGVSVSKEAAAAGKV